MLVSVPISQLPVVGDDNDQFSLVSPLLELDVATSLRNDIESGALQCANDLASALA